MKILTLFLFLQLFTLTVGELSLYDPVSYYLSTPPFSEKMAIDFQNELFDKNIRCIISGNDCDSLQLANSLTYNLSGVSWFGVDNKLNSREFCNPRNYSYFQEKYPIDPKMVHLPVRIPLGCHQSLIITNEKNLQEILAHTGRLRPGSLSCVTEKDSQYEYKIFCQASKTSQPEGTAFDYLALYFNGLVYG